jgi:hypothetical protein
VPSATAERSMATYPVKALQEACDRRSRRPSRPSRVSTHAGENLSNTLGQRLHAAHEATHPQTVGLQAG